MLRFILSAFGAVFTLITLGLFAAALTIGGIFFYYGRDLPNHEQLAQYTPPTISRIYSGEGRMIDEFAQERRIFDLIGAGYTNRQIAQDMYLAEKTVKNYMSNILSKLGMERRTEVAALAARLDEREQSTN